MRTHTFIAPRTLLSLASLLAVLACDEKNVVDPYGDWPAVADYGNMTGNYEGTVQGPGGSLSEAGTVALAVEQTDNAISGNMSIEAAFGAGADAIELSFTSAFTGSVDQIHNPHVILDFDNPTCGGTTRFTGGYAGEDMTLTLAGRYVHKGDDCSSLAVLNLGIAIQKTTE